MLNPFIEIYTNKIFIEIDSTQVQTPATRTERIYEDGDTYIDMSFLTVDEVEYFLRYTIYPSEFISPSARNILPRIIKE
jgi:hypothetical protein